MNIELNDIKKDDIEIIYNYKKADHNLINFTCRPLIPFPRFSEYYLNLKDKADSGKIIYKTIIDSSTSLVVGNIQAFDINNRNKSCEFGYYIIETFRNKGIGKKVITKYINYLFDTYYLNKIYATTSSNNYPSIKMLEFAGFKLDGRNREHYWIGDKKYDQLVYSILKAEQRSLKNDI